MYFTNCRTAEQVKAAFKQWAKKLHPDNGGNAEEFKRMYKEYQAAFNQYKTVHLDRNGQEYRKETNETAEDYARVIINLMRHKDLTIELCGSWVWISGNTKAYKEELKSLGCKWCSEKKVWCYHTNDGRRRRHAGEWSMDKIRNAYGSKVYQAAEDEKTA